MPVLSRLAFAMLLMLPSAAAVSEAAQNTAGSSAAICTAAGGTYTCDWEAFRRLLLRARNVSVAAQPLDRYTLGELRKLIVGMGKEVEPQGSAADLTITLLPVDPTGIDFGPADHDLATLQVRSDGRLVWVETYRGQSDRPWPIIVNPLIQQLKRRLAAK